MPLYVRPDSLLVLGDFRGDVCYDYLKNAEVLICGLGDGHSASADIYRAEGGRLLTLHAKRQGSRITLTYPAGTYSFRIAVAGTDISVPADASGKTEIYLNSDEKRLLP
jgi:alpha-D-xyloside xylohydrolase